jgi:hypothetical protein
MMYLLEPTLELWWSRQPATLWLDQARRHGFDLADIDDWSRAERSGDAVTIHLSLRHGVLCRRGVVVDGGVLSLHLAGCGPGDIPEVLDPREKLARTLEAARRKSGVGGQGLLDEAPRVDPEVVAVDPELVAALRVAPSAEVVRAWIAWGGSIPELPRPWVLGSRT